MCGSGGGGVGVGGVDGGGGVGGLGVGGWGGGSYTLSDEDTVPSARGSLALHTGETQSVLYWVDRKFQKTSTVMDTYMDKQIFVVRKEWV